MERNLADLVDALWRAGQGETRKRRRTRLIRTPPEGEQASAPEDGAVKDPDWSWLDVAIALVLAALVALLVWIWKS